MNKQAITFLSLFSLILVLSIYYIMLPSQDTQTSTNNDLNTIEELQTALDQKRDQIIAENNDIIAKESSTSESISKALETISETKELKDKEDRSAYFECCLVFISENGKIIRANGKTKGTILYEEEGDTSFGYDCLFLSEELKISFGKASKEDKNRVSHRAKALEELLRKID